MPRLGFRACSERGPPALPRFPLTHWPALLHHAAAWTGFGASPQRRCLPGQPRETVQAQLPAAVHSPGGEPAGCLAGSREGTLSEAPTNGPWDPRGTPRAPGGLGLGLADPNPVHTRPWLPPLILSSPPSSTSRVPVQWQDTADLPQSCVEPRLGASCCPEHKAWRGRRPQVHRGSPGAWEHAQLQGCLPYLFLSEQWGRVPDRNKTCFV